MKLFQFCRIVGAAMLFFQPLWAQTQPDTDGEGSLLGTVRDPSGAAIVGAHLAIRDEMGNVRDTQTDREGAYHFSTLSAGTLFSERRE